MATIIGDVQYSQNGTFTNPCKSLGWELLTFQPRLQIPEISSGLPMRSCKRCKPPRNLVFYVKIVGPSSWVNVPKQSSFHSSTKRSHVGSTSLFKHPKVMILSPKAQKTGAPLFLLLGCSPPLFFVSYPNSSHDKNLTQAGQGAA